MRVQFTLTNRELQTAVLAYLLKHSTPAGLLGIGPENVNVSAAVDIVTVTVFPKMPEAVRGNG